MRQPLAKKKARVSEGRLVAMAGFQSSRLLPDMTPIYMAFDIASQKARSERLNGAVSKLVKAAETKHE